MLFGDTLPRLHERAPAFAGADALALAAGFAASPDDDGGLTRTLGLAAANALTQWAFGRVGDEPPPAGDSIASIEPRAGQRVGTVGYFAPLVPAILAAAELVVVELRRDLLGVQQRVTVTDDAAALADGDEVVSTGTPLARPHRTSWAQLLERVLAPT